MKTKVPVTITIDREVKETIDRLRKEMVGVPVSQICNKALRDWIIDRAVNTKEN